MSHEIDLYFTASLGSFTTDMNQAREETRHTNAQVAAISIVHLSLGMACSDRIVAVNAFKIIF